MKDVYYNPSEYEPSLFTTLADNIKEDRTPEDLLFQVMLDLGILLSSKIQCEVLRVESGVEYTYYNVADGFLIACFDENINEEIITEIAKQKPYYFVMRDSSMASDSVAAYAEKSCAYMIWGINDKTHEIVGTNYNQYSLKIGNQEIESWLRNLLSKNAEFEFKNIKMNDKDIVVLIIYKAANQTVTFKKVDYIRVGSYTKKLSDYPQMQAQLWDKIRNNKFEEQYAKQDLSSSEALKLLDYATYFDLKKEPLPTDLDGILHYLTQEEILVKQDNGLYAITNLGGILFAKKLSDFPRLERKAVRVVQYSDNSKLEMLKEDVGNKGYCRCRTSQPNSCSPA